MSGNDRAFLQKGKLLGQLRRVSGAGISANLRQIIDNTPLMLTRYAVGWVLLITEFT